MLFITIMCNVYLISIKVNFKVFSGDTRNRTRDDFIITFYIDINVNSADFSCNKHTFIHLLLSVILLQKLLQNFCQKALRKI